MTAFEKPGQTTQGPQGSRLYLKKRLRNLREYTPTIILFFAVIFLWELAIWVFDIKQFLLPSPSAIVGEFAVSFPELRVAAMQTLFEAVGGLFIGLILAIVVALVAGRFNVAQKALIPLAIAVSSIPTIIFAPIMNNWFGSTNPFSKMALVIILVFFPIVINLVRGLTLVEPSALELMRSYGASELTILQKLRIPNSLPYLFTALKISATLALIGAIVGEYFGGPLRSLGVWIINQALQLRIASAWAAIFVACFLGIIFYILILAVERVVIPWHSSMRTRD